MSRRRDLMSLRDAVAAVGKELGLPEPDALTTLVRAWPALVGPALAQHSRVRSVRNGECTVEVDGPAWATQLRYLGGDLARRMNEACASPAVRSVRVVVARP